MSNSLIHETSPYLLQHAHNPVNWYAWNEASLQKARNENKLILVSIGYAACHWCHVMERESFENEQIAELMNSHFVCIKVDREERPDIDMVYMSAVQMLTGSGGWPLNCFTLPDGRPVYGGTYFRPKQWYEILYGLSNVWQNDPQKVIRSADEIMRGIKQSDQVVQPEQNRKIAYVKLMDAAFSAWQSKFDRVLGGENRAPKFPMPDTWRFLWRYSFHTRNAEALTHLTLTLGSMAQGGIYDQIGGGFARYSVDAEWKVPHFEKMLYDNAQLVSLYAEAYTLTPEPLYRKVVSETLAFVARELTSPEGMFYSSLDADSEGEEGRFYIWTADEINSLPTDLAQLCTLWYEITPEGNWEHGKNILHTPYAKEKPLTALSMSNEQFDQRLDDAHKQLFKLRAQKVRPGLDDKILASWNALMIKGYADAYCALGEESYLQTALHAAEFLHTNLVNADNSMMRSYKNGKSAIPAFLDDYVLTIEAYLLLFQCTQDTKWATRAKKLTDYVMQHFSNPDSDMLFYTSDLDSPLITRKMEVHDNVIPASNSTLAKCLYILGVLYYESSYTNKAKKMLAIVAEDLAKSVTYFANWGILLNWLANEPYELIITGKHAAETMKQWMTKARPDCIAFAATTANDMPVFENRFTGNNDLTIYVCQNRVCKMPVHSLDEALEMLK